MLAQKKKFNSFIPAELDGTEHIHFLRKSIFRGLFPGGVDSDISIDPWNLVLINKKFVTSFNEIL